MPLKSGHSEKAFKSNVRTLMGEVGESPHVQSRAQALAIAYSKKRGGYHSGGISAASAGGTPGAGTRRLGSLGVMGNAQHETLWGEPQYRALSGMNYEGHRYR